jgi:hypothetical protein
MPEYSPQSGEPETTEPVEARTPPRDRNASWAAPVKKLVVTEVPVEAVNLNVTGRQLTGPLRGFGQLWQKTYKVRLSGAQVTPEEVIRVWKENFPKYWPKGNRFFGRVGAITPGDVAVLNLAGPGGMTGPGGLPLISTGVMVIYADEVSFSFMTPEGHMFAGMITFNAYDEDQATVAQIQALIRANDPLYELTFRLGIGHKTEDEFWRQTLQSLAREFGVDGYISQSVIVVDPKVQWSQAKNIWQNAAIRTALNLPIRFASRLVSRR